MDYQKCAPTTILVITLKCHLPVLVIFLFYVYLIKDDEQEKGIFFTTIEVDKDRLEI